MRSRKLKTGQVLEFDDAEHHYSLAGSNAKIPGFSSINARLANPALIQWAANSAVGHIITGWKKAMEGPDGMLETTAFDSLCEEAKTAYRKIARDAADIGKAVHRFAQEALLADGKAEMPTDPKAAAGAAAVLEWLEKTKIKPATIEGTKCIELLLFSPRWYFAGTTDFFGWVEDEICVLDFKSSKPFSTWQGRRGPYRSMYFQLAAYSICLEEELGVKIDVGWVVRLDKTTGKPEPYRIELSQQLKDTWTYLVEFDRQLRKLEAIEKDV